MAQEGEMTFIQKLIAMQSELKCPKNAYNSFGKFSYRSTEDILEGLKPLLVKHQLLLTIDYEPMMVGEWHYAKATVTLTDGQTSFVAHGYAREPKEKKGMDDSQVTGTAFSYAAKRALGNLFLIDDTKDADADEGQQHASGASSTARQAAQQQPQHGKPMWDQLLDAFYGKVNALGYDANDVWQQMCGDVGFTPTPSITQQQFQSVMGWVGRIQ